MHGPQRPQAYPSQGSATRSPRSTWSTPSPRSTTVPTPSWPGTSGIFGLTGQSPRAAWMSVWHRPDASIWTTTCPWPGAGRGTSRISSGAPSAGTTAAFMVVLLMSSRTSWCLTSRPTGPPGAGEDDATGREVLRPHLRGRWVRPSCRWALPAAATAYQPRGGEEVLVRRTVLGLAALAAGYVGLHRLGRSAGSTAAERRAALPGDEVVALPDITTDHAVDVAAP